MTMGTLLAFGPIYIAIAASVVGLVLILLLGRAPDSGEPAAETDTRGAAEHPLIKELDRSPEMKVDFLVRMGFKELDYVAEDSGKGVTVFRAQNPMPLSGGSYLVRFVDRKKVVGGVIASPDVLSFISEVKHTEDVMKGILITSGAFSQNAWGVLEKAPVELIDGKHLLSLMKMWHPKQFEPDRV